MDGSLLTEDLRAKYTYKQIHTKFVFGALSYLSQDDGFV